MTQSTHLYWSLEVITGCSTNRKVARSSLLAVVRPHD